MLERNGESIPSQSALLPKIMQALQDAGGSAKTKDVYDSVAERVGLSPSARNRRIDGGAAGQVNEFERQTRWSKQRAAALGLVCSASRGEWALTQQGSDKLKNIVAGKLLTVFGTKNGFLILANCEDAVGVIEDESVSLLLTSPPFPIERRKEYQISDDHSTASWIEWMLRLCERWAEKLTPTGSMMINLGTAWEKGQATQSLYVERFLIRLQDALGFHLLQRLDWDNPALPPLPAEWVNRRRLRVKPSVQPMLWLSQNPMAYGNNRNVLVPYSKSMLRDFAKPPEEQTRPSGHTFGKSLQVDNGGAIPRALVSISNTASASKYRRACKAIERDPHPAMMPTALAEFGILLATEKGDIVYDPFGGAGSTGLAAEMNERFWIMSERSAHYAEDARLNFESNGFGITDYRMAA
jgi:DNA modification methylase